MVQAIPAGDYFLSRRGAARSFYLYSCGFAATALAAWTSWSSQQDFGRATAHPLTSRTFAECRTAAREAELFRQRDFDEFFFAGATEEEITEFQAKLARPELQVRPRGNLRSLAVGADLVSCVRELSRLYERAFRTHPFNIALSTGEDAPELFSCCNRNILLKERSHIGPRAFALKGPTPLELPFLSPETWERTLEAILAKRR